MFGSISISPIATICVHHRWTSPQPIDSAKTCFLSDWFLHLFKTNWGKSGAHFCSLEIDGIEWYQTVERTKTSIRFALRNSNLVTLVPFDTRSDWKWAQKTEEGKIETKKNAIEERFFCYFPLAPRGVQFVRDWLQQLSRKNRSLLVTRRKISQRKNWTEEGAIHGDSWFISSPRFSKGLTRVRFFSSSLLILLYFQLTFFALDLCAQILTKKPESKNNCAAAASQKTYFRFRIFIWPEIMSDERTETDRPKKNRPSGKCRLCSIAIDWEMNNRMESTDTNKISLRLPCRRSTATSIGYAHSCDANMKNGNNLNFRFIFPLLLIRLCCTTRMERVNAHDEVRNCRVKVQAKAIHRLKFGAIGMSQRHCHRDSPETLGFELFRFRWWGKNRKPARRAMSSRCWFFVLIVFAVRRKN